MLYSALICLEMLVILGTFLSIQKPSLVLTYQQLNVLLLTQVTAMLVLGAYPVCLRGLSPCVRSLSSGIGSGLIVGEQNLVLRPITCDELTLPTTMLLDSLKKRKSVLFENVLQKRLLMTRNFWAELKRICRCKASTSRSVDGCSDDSSIAHIFAKKKT
jgi:hypothetical protein